MRSIRRFLASALVLALVCALCLPALAAEETERRATILFTHDTHSHFLLADDGEGAYGGYTRLATLLRQERERAAAGGRACVTLDGGDFSMGTLFQTVFTTQAAELRTLGALGYDATTFGNHEFDYRSRGLAEMLNTARAAQGAAYELATGNFVDGEERAAAYRERYGPMTAWVPAIVQANYRTPKDAAEGAALVEAMANYPVTDYTVIEKDGVRFAVFGIMGVSSDDYAPMSGMVLNDPIESARRVVADIRANETYDFIVCLSHSGTEDGKGEDCDLARAVDGIDVIVSGHTHSTLTEPIRVNGTLIVSCGEYTKNLGVLEVRKTASGVELEDYRLIPINAPVAEDPDTAAVVEAFKSKVAEDYLEDYGYTFDQVLAVSFFDFTPISDFAEVQEEDGLGNLIADSYVYAVRQAEGERYTPVDFAVTASGVIRGSFARGEITVADAFNALSLGSGADGTAGYPLISVWITGRELRDAFEVDASITPIMNPAQLYGAGMEWSYNTNRMFFDKVTGCRQVLPDGTKAELEDNRLYRVVTGLYCGQMLGSVKDKSFGLLSITPRTADGVEVTDFEAQIVRSADGAEVKEWYALASYLESLGTVPEHYAAPEGRKTVYASWNPIDLLRAPRWTTLVILLIAAVVIAAAVLVVRWVIRSRRRRGGRSRRYRPYRGS